MRGLRCLFAGLALCLFGLPAFAGYDGPVICTALPALTGDVTTPGGSCATTLAKSTPIVIHGGSGSVLNGAGATDFVGLANLSTTEAAVQFPMPIGGTFTKLYVQTSVAPGASKTFVFTVDKGAVAQTITCTISGNTATSCNDTAHSFTFAAGDLISVKDVTSASSGTGTVSFGLYGTTP